MLSTVFQVSIFSLGLKHWLYVHWLHAHWLHQLKRKSCTKRRYSGDHILWFSRAWTVTLSWCKTVTEFILMIFWRQKFLKREEKKKKQVIYLHDKEQLILLLFMEARLLLLEVYWRKKRNSVISVGKMMNHVAFGKNMIQTQWNQKEYCGRFYFFLR